MADKVETNNYSDGDEVEENLLQAFRSKNSKRLEELQSSKDWPYLVHLDPGRENILSWFEFKKNAEIMEVGPGMGAITGLFLKKGLKVDAVELSKRRSEILKARFAGDKNLNVINENLLTYKTNKKYDYVTSIGVLEYAGMFVDDKDPFLKFVELLKSFVKEDGKVIIAIENRFGLKYWTGSPEDHHHKRFFDGLEDYPRKEGIKTFSKKELTELLKSAGLNQIEFFYPLPDYKFPVEVFSDKYKPSPEHNAKPDILEILKSRDKIQIVNERRVFDGIVSNDMFDFFANSFLVIAGK